jgi:hypothetical protein
MTFLLSYRRPEGDTYDEAVGKAQDEDRQVQEEEELEEA